LSHGKNAVVGVVAVKKKIWQIKRTTNVLLDNALNFYKCVQAYASGISLQSPMDFEKFIMLLAIYHSTAYSRKKIFF